jgi:hypothetical protein
MRAAVPLGGRDSSGSAVAIARKFGRGTAPQLAMYHFKKVKRRAASAPLICPLVR